MRKTHPVASQKVSHGSNEFRGFDTQLQQLPTYNHQRSVANPRRPMRHPSSLHPLQRRRRSQMNPGRGWGAKSQRQHGKDWEVAMVASIWQSDSVRNLLQLDLDLFTVGFNQCCFGPPCKKPTHILSSIPGLLSWGVSGWPQFDENNRYLGPILPCGCQVQTALAKKRNSEAFRTTGTSAYPAQMDVSLAQSRCASLEIYAVLSSGRGQARKHRCKRGSGFKFQLKGTRGLWENGFTQVL